MNNAAEVFLENWKKVVKFFGEDYFRLTAVSVEAATDKDQLRPDIPLIAKSLSAKSPSEQSFILAACSFFNDELTAEYQFSAPSISDLSRHLDSRHLNTLMALMVNDKGW